MQIVVKSLLKSVRMEKNISVRRLAEMTGMSKTYICDIENNHKIPTIHSICVLAVILEVKPEELFTYEVL